MGNTAPTISPNASRRVRLRAASSSSPGSVASVITATSFIITHKRIMPLVPGKSGRVHHRAMSDEGPRIIRLPLRRPVDLEAIPKRFDSLFPRPYYAYQLRLAVHNWLYRANEKRTREGFIRTREAMHNDAVNAEVSRLDRLQAAYWEDAIGGDLPSAQFCLRVIQERSKLQGLENPQANIQTQMNTLVIGGTQEEYIAALRRARETLGPAAASRVIEAGDQPDVVD